MYNGIKRLVSRTRTLDVCLDDTKLLKKPKGIHIRKMMDLQV